MPDSDDAARDRFSALYDQHYPAVLRYVARRIGAEAARDIAAETFLTAWRLFDRVPSEQPLPWPLDGRICALNSATDGHPMPCVAPGHLHCMVMSMALWPVFEDGHKHTLCDEGISPLRAYKELDAIAVAAGQMPLEAFDEHADVPADVVARLAEEAQDLPDLSGLPVVWHDPADAVATIDVILSALASPDLRWDGWNSPEEVADDLKAIRQTLQQAVGRQTTGLAASVQRPTIASPPAATATQKVAERQDMASRL